MAGGGLELHNFDDKWKENVKKKLIYGQRVDRSQALGLIQAQTKVGFDDIRSLSPSL